MTAQPGSDLTYRPDVDGLRAIAVGVVVLFHAKLGLFPGGYTGVDVFFVISGFLISSIIWRELQAGSFTIAGFYERRIRRIFPALAVIMLATLILGALFFAPQDYATLGRSARATAAFYSNFFFNNQFGYFMPGAETQPLLHTWSLAVEEQFYLVAPFFLILLARLESRTRILLFLALFAASLAISSIGAFGESKGAFYLPHSRAFELMLGMALVIGLGPQWRNEAVREGAAFAGLAMITVAAIFYSDSTPFPGLAALVPCVGTVLLISTAADKPTMVSRALSVAPVVTVGKISYSLYLWHWPLFVFAEYQYGERLPVIYSLGLIVLSVGLSFLTYWFVEQPARRRSFLTRRTVIASGLAVMAVLFAVSLAVVDTKGWPGRLSPEVRTLADMVAKSKLVPPCRDPNEGSASGPGCQIGLADAERPTFLFWGDSHAVPMATMIGALATKAQIKGSIAVVGGCAPLLSATVKNPLLNRAEKCRMMAERVDALLKGTDNAHVVIAARWAYYFDGPYGSGNNENDNFDTGDAGKNEELFFQSLRGTIERIRATGRTVTLVGPVPELKFHLPNAMMKAMMRGETGAFSIPYGAFEKRQTGVFRLLTALDALDGVSVVYPHKALCDLSTCRTTTPQMPLYVDDDHLSSFGTQAIAGVLADALSVSTETN